MKLPRAVLAQWLSFDKKDWTLIGKDTDSMSTSMNPDIDTKQNVLGETITEHKGFKPELAVDSYAARTEDSIYEPLLDITMNRKYDEESTSAYLLESVLDEAVVESDNKTLLGQGWMEEVTVVPQEYGGGTEAFGIPFNVSPKGGGRTKGSVSVTNRVPTFTPESETNTPAAASVTSQSGSKGSAESE